MKIAVVGPGAMGCYFAAMLTKGGHQVTLVDHRADRAGRLRSNGVTLEIGREKIKAEPAVSTTVPRNPDFLIIAVKSHATNGLALKNGTRVLTIQQGLGNVESLCHQVGSACVMVGITDLHMTLVEEGRTRQIAAGPTHLGAWTSCDTTPCEEALRSAGIDVVTSHAPGQQLWERAAIRSAIDPLAAVLQVNNGQLLAIREVRQLMRDLVVEAVKVAATEGYRFPYSLVETAEQVCQQTDGHISPMLTDIRARRLTEIDALNGEIMRRGELAGLPTPRTRMIWQLVRGLELRS